MRRLPLLTQIVAVFSRRTPAFQPSPGQPQTFGGAFHRVVHPHIGSASKGRGGQHATALASRPDADPADPGVPAAPEDPVGAANAVVEGVPNLARFADEFTSRPAHERLPARAWLESPFMELAHQLFHVRGIASALARDGALPLILALDHALDHALDLNGAFDRVRIFGLARKLDPTRDPAQAPDPASGVASALALARDLARVLALVRNPARDLDIARDLARELDIAVARLRAVDLGDAVTNPRVYILAGSVLRVLRRDIQILRVATEAKWHAAAETITRLRSAAGDMVGADLRRTDLRDVPLAGVRWSTSTRWPEALRDWIGTHSKKIGPDLYEIQNRYESDDRTAALTG